jgi:hypothetical protein
VRFGKRPAIISRHTSYGEPGVDKAQVIKVAIAVILLIAGIVILISYFSGSGGGGGAMQR